MKNTLKNIIFVLLLVLILPINSFATDSTSFNPEHVKIEAGGGFPIGFIVAWTVAGNPSPNWLECNGQAVSNQFPNLRKLMSHTPDYRGMFLRGHGSQNFNSGGKGNVTHSSGGLNQIQGDSMRNITGQFGRVLGNDHHANGVFVIKDQWGKWGRGAEQNSMNIAIDASRQVPTASENRPINKAVRYFIKAK